MSKKKQKLPDTHKTGKRTGYDLIDGKYHIAPMYVEMFDHLLEQWAGVDAVLAAVSRHCQRDYAVLAQDKKKLWDALREDFGVEFRSGEWRYEDGKIIPVPKQEDK